MYVILKYFNKYFNKWMAVLFTLYSVSRYLVAVAALLFPLITMTLKTAETICICRWGHWGHMRLTNVCSEAMTQDVTQVDGIQSPLSLTILLGDFVFSPQLYIFYWCHHLFAASQIFLKQSPTNGEAARAARHANFFPSATERVASKLKISPST